MTVESEFYTAAYAGKLDVMTTILQENPALDVNWRYPDSTGWCALHAACYKGHEDVVKFLLKHVATKVNQKTSTGDTPFMMACFEGKKGVAKLMIRDPRVLVNEADNFGHTPLKWLGHYGFEDIIKAWIASPKELNFGTPNDKYSDPISAANQKSGSSTARLLEKYKKDPEGVKKDLKRELGVRDTTVPELFISIVMVSENYFAVTQGDEKANRFFRIASALPMELQMQLCNTLSGSSKPFIPKQDIEDAYQLLIVLIY